MFLINVPFQVRADQRYDGPEFEEFCIREGKFLAASRDRHACLGCPLENLCQAGFEEQVLRVSRGQNPSLTEGVELREEMLSGESLLAGLTPEQITFVTANITLLREVS